MKQGEGVRHGATAALRRNLKVSPDIDQLLTDVACLSGKRRLEAIGAAEAAVHQALDRRPDDPNLLVASACLLSAQDREDEAAECAARALAADPTHKAALQARINFLRYARQFEPAKSALNEALAAWPDDPDLLVAGAWLLSAQDRELEAAEWADRALAIDPQHAWALQSKIEFLTDARQFEPAESTLHEALAAWPDDPDLLVTGAWLFSTQDRETEATEWADRALTVDPRHARALRSRVVILTYAHQFVAAGSAVQDALEAWPDDPDLLVAGAWLLSAQDREDEAAEWADRALTVAPRNGWALQSKIQFLTNARQFKAAELAIDQALAVRPNDPTVLVRAAWVSTAQDREEESIERAERALTVAPRDGWAWQSKIHFLTYARRFEPAEVALGEALDQRPDDPGLLTAGAWLFSAQDREDEAVQWIERALAITPLGGWALRSKIDILRYARRFEAAEVALREALDRRPDDPDLLTAGAWLFSAQDRDLEAAEWADRVLTIAPRNGWAWQSKIQFLTKTHSFEAAEAALREALDRRPDDPDLLSAGAWVLSAQDREDEAVLWAERALAVDPRNGLALQSKIDYLRYARRFEAAEVAFGEALDQRPDDPNLLTAGAWLFSAQDREDEAVQLIERALTIAPRDGWALQSKIDILTNARQFKAAEVALREALDQRPDDPNLLTAGAWVFSTQDREDEAVQWAERARALAPRNESSLQSWVEFLRYDRRFQDARDAAYQALEIQPRSAALYSALGRVQDAALEFDAALESFSEGLRLKPGSVEIHLDRSAALRSLRRYDEAGREIGSLSKVRPYRRGLKMEIGWIHHDARRLPEANQVFEVLYSSAVSSSERSTALFGLGWVAFSRYDYSTAEEKFRTALSLRDTSENKLALAWSLARQSSTASWTEAEALAYEIPERSSHSASAHICLGVLAFKQGNLASSEHHLTTALKVDPYSGSHTDLGALYAHMCRQDEAEEQFRAAIQRDWYDLLAHIELGAILLQSGDERAGEAEREFRRAVSIDPASATAAIGLAEAQDRAGNDSEAESCLRRALRQTQSSESWRIELALARLLIRRGDKQQNPDLYAEAYTYSQRAIGRAPDRTAEPHYLAGVAQYRIGSLFAEAGGRSGFRRAQRHLRACLRRDADHSEAERALAALERQMATARRSAWGGWALGGVSVGMLIAIWTGFLTSSKVTSVVVASTTPALIGLLVVAVLLPSLIRLKLPGFQADLRPRLAEFTAGPTGDITFGPGRLTVTSGPTGQLSRRSSSDRY